LGRARDTFERGVDAATLDVDEAAAALATIERMQPGDAENVRLRTRLDEARREHAGRLERDASRALDAGDLERAERLIATLRGEPGAASLDALEARLAAARVDVEIRAVITRFEATKEKLDAEGYANLFADPSSVRARTRAAFDDLESQRIEIDHVEIALTGDRATVSFHERVTYKARSGSAAELEQVLTLDLIRREGHWLIERQTRRR
jgi:hypothetical protein